MDFMHQQLQQLEAASNLRHLPALIHDGRDVIVNGQRMLNLSSNDYLGLAADRRLREAFLETLTPDTFLPTSSSSRLLTGNFTGYTELEQELAQLFGTEAALVFNSGYHANTGILPAVSDAQTLTTTSPRPAGSSKSITGHTAGLSSSPRAFSAWTAMKPTCAHW